MKLHLTNKGRGRPLLMAHGWGSSGKSFAALQAALAPAAECVAVDLRGFGRTGLSPDGHNITGMAADLAEIAEHTGPVVALGHSMGGAVVTRLALGRPELVAGLVVLDPAYGADQAECSTLPQREAALMADGGTAAASMLSGAFSEEFPPEQRAAILTELATSHPRVLLDSFRGMYLEPGSLGPLPQAQHQLTRRRQPTLALYSTEAAARREAAVSPSSDIRLAPGPGHYIHLEHPAWTVQVTLDWLRRECLL